jgi:hypothetical protein
MKKGVYEALLSSNSRTKFDKCAFALEIISFQALLFAEKEAQSSNLREHLAGFLFSL